MNSNPTLHPLQDHITATLNTECRLQTEIIFTKKLLSEVLNSQDILFPIKRNMMMHLQVKKSLMIENEGIIAFIWLQMPDVAYFL